MSLHNYNIYIRDLKPERVEDICKDAGVDPEQFLEDEADLIVGEINFSDLYVCANCQEFVCDGCKFKEVTEDE